MKKYFEKFSIVFVMSLMLVLGCCTNVFAADTDIKMNEFDDKDSAFTYENMETWYNGDIVNFLNGGVHKTKDTTKKSSVKFNFNGTQFKLRVQCYIDGRNNNLNACIDGKAYNFSAPQKQIDGHTQYYQSPILNLGEHTVSIEKAGPYNDGYIWFDQVDVDGKLLPYNKSISLNKCSMDLTKGGFEQLTAITIPVGAGVIWTSSDTSVATVDITGKVTALKAGAANIMATTTDGSNLSATCVVTITDPTPSTPTTDRAVLTITMSNNIIKTYDLSKDELNAFLNWYDSRSKGTAQVYYIFENKPSGGNTTNKDYIPYDKIEYFNAQEYKVQ